MDAGALLLNDILAQLARPGRDPREDLPAPFFKKGVIKLDDLTSGMELSGTVLNVVDFGAFVDIGLHDTGLVHISQLANKYVRDPHEVVSVGDIVKVWVHEIDKTRRRVSLTMIAPGTQRTQSPRRADKRKGDAKQALPVTPSDAAPADAQATATATQERRPPRPQQQSPRPQQQQQYGGGRRPDRGSRPAKPNFKARPEHKPKPKPLVPLTNEMKAGKEPLRTFGDLKQFFDLKTEEEPGPEESKSEA